jgi:acyl transferase domain-containing protein/NADPH:quinone reductase-like Zn-dependent oxidoreductase/thioesterase domain-containing protein/acyl carrier protein/SAM-dependent methyltransferase
MTVDPIAIVGIGCRFPGGAKNPAVFWQNLCAGADGITEIPPDRWNIQAYYDPAPGRPGKTNARWGGFIDDIGQFDPAFFAISPREAESMDPQQRLLLEAAWEALEDGGQVLPSGKKSPMGVFVGISTNDYSLMQSTLHDFNMIDIYTTTGSVLSIAANRISYCLNLSGPSVAVDTACSSSLVALHLACQSLRSGECPAALVGGVNALLGFTPFISFSRMSMLSPDGRCKAFDAAANGFVRGEGVGVVLLKPLQAAQKDGDPIYAVILATAVNQDGRTGGITVPSRAAQRELIIDACRQAGLDPAEIQYVEAHGAGTAVGDPIEAQALGEALGTGRAPDNPCLIGSVKTNIGHLEAGAGLAGLIKLALMLKHRQIPPNLHFKNPNPNIDFSGLKLRVPTRLEPFPHPERRLLSGINSFGFGGTNAHAILEAPPPGRRGAVRQPESGRPVLLALSARSPEALRATAQAYQSYLEGAGNGSGFSLDDICYTAGDRRTHHRHRLALAAANRQDLIESIKGFVKEESRPGTTVGSPAEDYNPQPVFVFSGQGPQWWAMGRQLLAQEPVFRRALEDCDRLLAKLGGWSLMEELMRDEASSRLASTAIAQPAIFALQVGLAALWRSWGIQPAAVVGHSVGEAAAAQVAGLLTLADAAYAIFERARSMEAWGGQGRMLAADLDREEAVRIIAPYAERVSLAAVNSPNSVTLSGDGRVLQAIAETLEKRQVFCRFLNIRHAFHSQQMDPVHDHFLSSLRELEVHRPEVPLFSTVGGREAGGGDFGRAYWWENIRRTVRFGPAIEALLERGYRVFLELSPHPVLSGSISECLAHHSLAGTVLPSLRRRENERLTLLGSLGALHTLGCRVDWRGVFPGAEMADLPTYPWQQAHYWSEAGECREARLNPPLHPLLEHKLPAAQPTWQSWLDKDSLNTFQDHRVLGRVVMPAAAYVDMALAAGRAVSGSPAVSLEEMDFHKALMFPEGEDPLRLQLTYRPQESTFTISSCPAKTGAEWVEHATGRLRPLANSVPAPAVAVAQIRKRCSRDIPLDLIYRRFREAGLSFGPAFQGIAAAWRGKDEALGRLQLPAHLESEQLKYVIHPALLDACFQVLSAALPENPDGYALYLPVQIERLQWYAGAGRPAWSHARLVRRAARLIVGDIHLLDEEGQVLMAVEGFHCRAAAPARRETSAGLDDWLYENVWQPCPLPQSQARPLPKRQTAGLNEIAGRLERLARRREAHTRLSERLAEAVPDLDVLCRHYILDAFRQLGGELRIGQRLQPGPWMDELGIVAGQRQAAGRFLQCLEEDRILKRTGPGWTVRRAGPPADTDSLWRKILRRFPASYPVLALLRLGGRRLAGVLRGGLDPRSILFSSEWWPLIEHFYQDSWVFQDHNLYAAEAVGAVIDRLGPGRRVRILEVGAGAGGLTAYVLPRLPAERTEYFFTDKSDEFFQRAEQKFFDYPFVRYRTLGLETPSAEQGLEPHSFDIVLASQVRPAGPDLRETLNQVRQLLAGQGLLIMLHTELPGRWFSLVSGLLDGAKLPADKAAEPPRPALDQGSWLALLRELGFAGGRAVSLAGGGSSGLCRRVLLARAPSAANVLTAQPANPRAPQAAAWVVFADSSGTAEALAGKLRGRADRVVMVNPGAEYRRRGPDRFEIRAAEPADMTRLLADLSANGDGPVARFVHCWALEANGLDDIGLSQLDRAESAACHSVLHLVQALAAGRAAEPVRIWLVTNGAQAIWPGQKVSLSQSMLWGLGRVLINEQPSLRCRLIDLSPAADEDDGQALFDELLFEDSEDEVAIRGSDRYVSRLVKFSEVRRPPRPGPARRPPGYRLETAASGTLDHLAFRSRPRRKPGPGQVEIEVQAAALNFRDVMKALHIYPSDKDEDQLLGDECAGRVTAVGRGVKGLSLGAEVVAIGSGCFASRVTVPAAAVRPKPPGLSFEEAVTIPVAFLTAYYALYHLGQLKRGERVLIQAAAGGVGLAAVQLARLAGAEIFATAGSTEKRELLRALGVHHVLDSRSLTFADEIRRLTGGRGVEVVLNSLAGEALAQGLSVLSPYGRFLEIGKRDVFQNSRIGLRPLRNNAALFVIDLAQAMQDKPALLASQMKQIMDWVARGKLSPLPHRVFPIDQIVNAFRHMSQARHVGKVVVSRSLGQVRTVPQTKWPLLRFDSRASYLVAGGLGGFGLAVAEWMARNGARRLILVSRRGASTDKARAGLVRLRRLGAKVSVWKADISNRTDVSRVFRRIEKDWPPLRGIVQAAMVIDDGLLTSLDRERFRRVIAPKVHGAWNLHEMSLAQPLDFFVMFSSITSLVGNPGQGNYAAANAFLDGLAHYRRALGRPALTVNWGLLSEVGYAARRQEIQEHLARLGLSGITPAQATEALGFLLPSDVVQVGVANLDWKKWSASALGVRSPRYAELARQQEKQPPGEGQGIRESVLSAAGDRKLDLVTRYVREQAAKVIRIGVDKLDVKRPLTDLGLDSLMAVELGLRLEKQLGVPLPPGKFTAGTSVATMAATILELMTGAWPGPPAKKEGEVKAAPTAPEPAAGSLLVLRAGGGRDPLFCFHPAAGLVRIYYDLMRSLPADLPVYGLQSRAIGGQQSEHDSLEAMAEDYATLIERCIPRGHCHLFGFSFGGFSALATARVLEKRNRQVRLVGLADANLDWINPGTSKETLLRRHILDMYDIFARELRMLRPVDADILAQQADTLAAAMLTLSGPERVERVLDWLTEQDYLNSGLKPENIKEYISLYDHHLALLRAYRPQQIQAPLFCWLQQRTQVPPAGLQAAWKKLTAGTATVRFLAGRHYDLMFPPLVEVIADQLNAALLRIGESGPALVTNGA